MPEPSWATIPEQRREEIMERHQDNERSVSSSLLLCNETIHMIMYVRSVQSIEHDRPSIYVGANQINLSGT